MTVNSTYFREVLHNLTRKKEKDLNAASLKAKLCYGNAVKLRFYFTTLCYNGLHQNTDHSMLTLSASRD